MKETLFKIKVSKGCCAVEMFVNGREFYLTTLGVFSIEPI